MTITLVWDVADEVCDVAGKMIYCSIYIQDEATLQVW